MIRLNQLPLPNSGPKIAPVPTTALDRIATLFKTIPHMSGTLHYHYAIPILSSSEQHHLLVLCGNKLQFNGRPLLCLCLLLALPQIHTFHSFITLTLPSHSIKCRCSSPSHSIFSNKLLFLMQPTKLFKYNHMNIISYSLQCTFKHRKRESS